MQPLLGKRTVTLFINIDSVRRTRRLSIDQHSEFHRCSRRGRAHDEIKVARVKAVSDAATGEPELLSLLRRIQHPSFNETEQAAE